MSILICSLHSRWYHYNNSQLASQYPPLSHSHRVLGRYCTHSSLKLLRRSSGGVGSGDCCENVTGCVGQSYSNENSH